MPSRKAHHKTRLGCSPCKKRRIKCDENRPACINCVKKGLECSFLALIPSNKLSTPSSFSSPLAQEADPPQKAFRVHVFRHNPGGPGFDGLNLPPLSSLNAHFIQDLYHGCPGALRPRFQELLRHFDSNTSLTLANDQPARTAWRTAIPQLASTHRFLIHGLIATSSLHIARLKENVEDERLLVNIAASQMNIALSHYRRALMNITEENCGALFAFSTFVTLYIVGTAPDECKTVLPYVRQMAPVKRKEAIDETVRISIKMIRALRGALVILVPSWEWIEKSMLAPIITRKWWPKHPTPATERAVEEDRKLCALERIWMRPGRHYEYHFTILDAAVQLLRQHFALVSMLTITTASKTTSHPGHSIFPVDYEADDTTVGTLIDRGAALVWPIKVSTEFLALVDQQCPEALAILAHYAILPGRIRGVWWLEGMASTLITTAALVLGEERWDWIQWPAQVCGIDLRGVVEGKLQWTKDSSAKMGVALPLPFMWQSPEGQDDT